MNFLSHYYFTRPVSNPYYTLGSILPDLFRNHHYKWKFNLDNQGNAFKHSPHLSSIYKGWDLHIQVDSLFHNSEAFKYNTGKLRQTLVHVFPRPPKRPFFLAHVGYELLLDSLLIETNQIDTASFYRDLKECDKQQVNQFMDIIGIEEKESFHSFLHNFIDSRYLESYNQTQGVAYALDRIGRRVWVESFTEDESREVIAALDNFKQLLRPNFLEIFDKLEKQIKNI